MKRWTWLVLSLVWLGCAGEGAGFAQQPFNYDESKIPPYKLPDPLTLDNGDKVTSAAVWYQERRPQLLQQLGTEIFGLTPSGHVRVKAMKPEVDPAALGGTAIREQVTLVVKGRGLVRQLHLLLYLPASAHGPVPVFLGLNFSGNQTVSADPGIQLTPTWAHPPNSWLAVSTPLRRIIPDPSERGQAASQWQVEKTIAAGYGLATIYDGDIEPDSPIGLAEGIRPLFYRKGQTAPDADQWGTLGAWAWGLSRAADYLRTVRGVDGDKIILFGHSRLGKTALWAAAQDQHFDMVIANESGKGGAALLKRNFGQTVLDLNDHFPHWFCGNFKKYSDREAALSVDANELIALIAPRPFYIGAATEDIGGDPNGQFLAEVAAGPVYALLNKEGLETGVMPAVGQPVQHDLGFHLRPGRHGVTAYDWEQYIKFADRFYKTSSAERLR